VDPDRGSSADPVAQDWLHPRSRAARVGRLSVRVVRAVPLNRR
jgi:hypothetical protein